MTSLIDQRQDFANSAIAYAPDIYASQTFISGASGRLDAINIGFSGNQNAQFFEINIYEGAIVRQGVSIVADPIYSGTFFVPEIAGDGDLSTYVYINASVDVIVLQGMKYTFSTINVSGGVQFYGYASSFGVDRYEAGEAFGGLPNTDLVFRTLVDSDVIIDPFPLFSNDINEVNFDLFNPDNYIGAVDNSLGGNDYVILPGTQDGNDRWGLGLSFHGGIGDDVIIAGGVSMLINGDEGDDLLVGGSQDDTLDGGEGIDTAKFSGTLSRYLIVDDGNGNVIVTDTAANSPDGTDTLVRVDFLQFADQRISTSALVGASITGTAGNDVISLSQAPLNQPRATIGNDIVRGLGGSDTIETGAGDDLINGGTGNDTIDGGTGTDTATYVDATASVKVNLSLTAAQNTGLAGGTDRLVSIENLIGSAFNDTLTGNSGDNRIEGLGGNNTMVGGAGNDTLIGGAGTDKLDGGLDVDTMTGGAGNDTYTVNDSNDVVIELLAQGTDAVNASATFTLSANVEKLTLTGALNIDGTGNELANTITGNTGNNTLSGLAGKDIMSGGLGDDLLIGGLGADTLTGGAGADRFRFDVLETALNKDTVKDFVRGTDVIELSRSAFSALAGYGAGALDASELALGTKATLPGQNLVYNAATGALFYDNDGSGAQAQVQIAVFSTKPLLDAGDFVLI